MIQNIVRLMIIESFLRVIRILIWNNFQNTQKTHKKHTLHLFFEYTI
jgi:uncharacterized protein YgfB (UPF0149 family)